MRQRNVRDLNDIEIIIIIIILKKFLFCFILLLHLHKPSQKYTDLTVPLWYENVPDTNRCAPSINIMHFEY